MKTIRESQSVTVIITGTIVRKGEVTAKNQILDNFGCIDRKIRFSEFDIKFCLDDHSHKGCVTEMLTKCAKQFS